jgi:hypothetical protein
MHNVLQQDEKLKLWSPELSFTNALGPYQTLVDDTTAGRVVRQWEGVPNALDADLEAIVYKGSENSIIFTREYFFDFDCPFDLKSYPFDTQVLNVIIIGSLFFDILHKILGL